MSVPIIKEEKIEIKQGLLKMPGNRLFDTLKSWKQRYFVFCQIRRGNSGWLRLFYYKNSSFYKEGRMPKDFIDITTAISIGMMDQDIDGHGHIIYIHTPGKTYYLSSSSCDDRSQWLLALRAYKYNDESRLPSSSQSVFRTYSWHSKRPSRSEAATRRISEPALPSFIATDARIEKFRAKYMICRKCRGIDVPREVYEWVRPYDCEIYATIYHRPPKSDSERIYEEPRFLAGDANSTREALPLPFTETPIERSKSCVELTSKRSSHQFSKRRSVMSDTQLAFIREMSDEEGDDPICSLPGTSHTEGYVSMIGNADEIEKEKQHSNCSNPVGRPLTKSIPAPSNVSVKYVNRSPKLDGSETKCDKIFSEYIGPSGAFSKTPPGIVSAACNRYTKDPIGSRKSTVDAKGSILKPSEGATSVSSLIDSNQKQFTDNKQTSFPAEKQNSASGVGKHILKKRYSIEDPLFIAHI